MSDLRTAAQQALAHVQEFKRRWMAVPPFGNKVNKATREAVTLAHMPVLQLEEALRAALEQPEQAEPVDAEAALRFALAQRDWAFKQLQAQPDRREWRSLSEEEIAKCWHDTPWNADLKTRVFAFFHTVEAKLKEKNYG